MVMSFLGLFWTRGKVALWPGSHSRRHVFPGMWYGCTRVWFWRELCLAFSPTQPMTFRSSPITAPGDQRESAGPGLRPCKPVSIPVVYSGVRAKTLQTSEYPSGVFRCQGWDPANQWVSQWCIQVFELRTFKPLSIPVVYTGVRAETQQTIEYPSGVFRCQSWEPANQWVSQWCIWVSELRTNKPLSIPIGVFKCQSWEPTKQ